MTLLLAAEGHGEAVNEVVQATTGLLGLSWLIPVVPLLGFVLVLALTKTLRERAAFVAIAAAAVSFLLSVGVAAQMLGDPATYVRPIGTFIEVGGFEVAWDLYIDQLTTVMLLVVTGVGLLVHIYSLGYMHGDVRFARFFAYLNLFLFSMLVLVLGANLVTLFVGWELVGLSSYLLIGFWFEKAEYASAAKKAFITNRVGDVSFMIGMFLAFSVFGTLDFLGIIENAETLASGTALALVLLFLGGAAAKSAQIPLYVWLPDAMAGPTPVSALIHAATMVTAGVYLTVRLSPVLVQSVTGMEVIAWIGVATVLLGALIALRQDDIKKILAYSTVSQLGYMFVGVGVGAFREGIFHLVTHAFFKGLLFLAAGSVMHAMANRTDAWGMGGLRKVMPITFWTSAIGWLAISGVPPLSGFFSKDQILTEAYMHGYFGIWLLGLLGAVLTAFYMSRWFFLIFLGKPRFGHDVHPHESPASMTAPLIVLAVLSVAGSLLNPVHHGPLYNFLAPVVGDVSAIGYEAAGPIPELGLIGAAVVAGAIGIGLAFLVYVKGDLSRGRMLEPIRGTAAEVLERKFYVDEVYSLVFVRIGGRIADAMVWFDTRIVDGVVNGAGAGSLALGRVTRRAQTGLVRGYAASFLLGALVLVGFLVFSVR
ncbi:NADH-quinone oxidoreductase subunit L [Egicoccus halophilus]|uniref:NADH-quinone oxidoreductase subunit L n=1 Tax=Egicoccus halophilus TaxID=1670830 RepID=A0A8J3AD68_9ACTN|nr:NADH-quinone oxidoreductase subunit L [Egicoccus halophilus]GGI05737.1 NADH-quinone oxidoreductase subunit L [Egicoccus halophilus]